MTKHWIAFSVTLLVTLQVGLCDWRDAPYDEDESFNERVRYTDDAVLRCNDSRVAHFDYEVKKWILPNLDLLYPGNSTCFDTLDGEACCRVSSDGFELDIELVQDEHFGLYYCEVEDLDTGLEYVVKRGLNYKGAYFGNTWPKYEKAAIWSICWSVIFAVLGGLGGILYVKKYPDEDDDEEEKEEEQSDDYQKDTKYAYENTGYAIGENNSVKKTDETPAPAYDLPAVTTVNEEDQHTRQTDKNMPNVEEPEETTSF